MTSREGDVYFILRPENHFPGTLPGCERTEVTKLVTPRFGHAQFGCYLIRFATTGASQTLPFGFEHFFFILSGCVELSMSGTRIVDLAQEAYAYAPDSVQCHIKNQSNDPSEVVLIKRRYEHCAGVLPPDIHIGQRNDIEMNKTRIDGLLRQELLPRDDPSYDFMMSILRFAPGAELPAVEIHDEEHGLYVIQGEGKYLLGDTSHGVGPGDFIYMSPYCPQRFWSTGRPYTEYLLYKDAYRDGFWTAG